MKFFRVFCAFILVFSIFFTIFIGKNKINENVILGDKKEYKTVLSLWHVDTFEGGSGSRKQFLLDASIAFEKQNTGVLIMVTSMSLSALNNNLKNGVFPDILSSGIGSSATATFAMSSKNSFYGGKVGDRIYAKPWCRGNYFLISKKADVLEDKNVENLIVSEGENNLPILSLILDGVYSKNAKILPPQKAYTEFLNDKNGVLLGTQRDIVRLNQRGYDYHCKPLFSYNDLYQYFYILTNNAKQGVYAENFIDFVLGESYQDKLSKLQMLSNVINVDCYEDIATAQNTAIKNTISAFILPERLGELKKLCALALTGDKDAENKLKKLVVTPWKKF